MRYFSLRSCWNPPPEDMRFGLYIFGALLYILLWWIPLKILTLGFFSDNDFVDDFAHWAVQGNWPAPKGTSQNANPS